MSGFNTIARVTAAGEVFRDRGGEAVARQVIGRGGDLGDFYRAMAPRMGGSGLELDRQAGINTTEIDVRTYSISRLVRTLMQNRQAHGMPLPNPFDKNADVDRASILADMRASCFEIELAGSRVPWSVLTARDFSTAQAAAVIPTKLGTDYTGDALRAAMPLAALGALMPVLPARSGGFKVPVITGDVTNVEFLGEVEAATAGNPTTGMADFSPKRAGGVINVSRQALLQGERATDEVLSRTINGKVSSLIQAGAINGSGTGDDPLGIRATPGINTAVGGTNGLALAWSHVIGLEYEPAIDNAFETASGYLINPATRRYLKKTQRAAGLPFMWDGGALPLNGHRAAVTTAVPNDLVKGSSGAACSSVIYSADWAMLMVAIYGGVELEVDPFTRAAEGIVRLIVNVYCASGVLHPAAFAVMDDALLP